MSTEREIRICDHCGKPMQEGYVIDGCAHACCKECAVALYDNDKEAFEADLEMADEGETYFTTWESIYED